MRIDAERSYDLIGDLHGCADSLCQLLQLLGYRQINGVWQHPRRMAIFLGDIIDRGKQIRATLEIVYRMVQSGNAYCLMGNHEYYALAWHLPAPTQSRQLFVRDHNSRNARLWQETAEEFSAHPQEWQDYLDWFAGLPLFLDGTRFRCVHAYWDEGLINQLRNRFAGGQVNLEFVRESAVSGSLAHQAFNRLLRGVDLPLPEGLMMYGRDGLKRRTFRARFWQLQGRPLTYSDLAFQPDPMPAHIARRKVPQELVGKVADHGEQQPILFVGHYWCKGEPAAIRPNLACLDYSAVSSGKLVAYRLDEEAVLDANKFVWVDGPAK